MENEFVRLVLPRLVTHRVWTAAKVGRCPQTYTTGPALFFFYKLFTHVMMRQVSVYSTDEKEGGGGGLCVGRKTATS